MKKLVTLLMAFGFLATVSAQHKVSNDVRSRSKKVAFVKEQVTGLEPFQGHSVPPSQTVIRDKEIEIGTTTYDLQANNSDANRLTNLGNGNILANWIFSDLNNISGGANRGTAINVAQGGVWGPHPTARIEPVRTGFGQHCVTEQGTVFAVAHIGVSATNYQLYTTRLPAGGSAFVNGQIPSATPNGQLWSRCAAGSGNTVHVIAETAPATFGGAAVNGVDGNIVYFRSLDGGATWDKQDVVLPGADSMLLANTSAEAYSIGAFGDKVAIVSSSFFGDINIWESNDNGSTWEHHYIYDFPIDGYTYDDAYTEPVDTFDAGLPAPGGIRDDYAVFSPDYNVSCKVDALGNVHVAFGAFYVVDTIPGDGFFTWYGASGGVFYWNSSYGYDTQKADGEFPISYIAAAQDLDGDTGTFPDGDATNNYGNAAIASLPSIGFGGNGEVYVSYQSPDERYVDANTAKVFAHVYIVNSPDGGETWNWPPYDIANADISNDPGSIDFLEHAFAYMANDCSDKIHLMYQQDFTPGYVSGVNTATDWPANSEMYVGFDAALLVKTKDVAPVEFAISPNPTADILYVDLTEKATISVFDVNGAQVISNVSGEGRKAINVAAMPSGLYFLNVQTEKGVGVKKFMVAR